MQHLIVGLQAVFFGTSEAARRSYATAGRRLNHVAGRELDNVINHFLLYGRHQGIRHPFRGGAARQSQRPTPKISSRKGQTPSDRGAQCHGSRTVEIAGLPQEGISTREARASTGSLPAREIPCLTFFVAPSVASPVSRAGSH